MAEDAVARVARGSSLLLGQLISNLIAIGAFTLIARGISRAEVGIATITNLLITLGVILSGAGVPISSIRFISESIGAGSDYRPLITASILKRFGPGGLLSQVQNAGVEGLPNLRYRNSNALSVPQRPAGACKPILRSSARSGVAGPVKCG